MRMTRRERRIGTCRGAAGEEEAPTGGATGMAFVGMASAEFAGMASAGEALTADGAGLAAAEGDGFEAGVE